jgi:hypothetical protein
VGNSATALRDGPDGDWTPDLTAALNNEIKIAKNQAKFNFLTLVCWCVYWHKESWQAFRNQMHPMRESRLCLKKFNEK